MPDLKVIHEMFVIAVIIIIIITILLGIGIIDISSLSLLILILLVVVDDDHGRQFQWLAIQFVGQVDGNELTEDLSVIKKINGMVINLEGVNK